MDSGTWRAENLKNFHKKGGEGSVELFKKNSE